MIVLFSVRSVLCPVYMYCVCIDIACPHFFVHVRLRSFGSMTPPFILTIPVLFHIILCCFRSNFGSSVLCPVYMYCVLYLAFLHVAIFFLFAVLPGFCLSVLAMYFVLSSTLQTPPFLLNWYQNKVHVTPSVPFHLHCSVVCPDILSTVQYILLEYYAPFVYARVGEGSGRAMGDSGSCSGVLKYAVT